MTHPKTGERRLKHTIQELKAENNRLERENRKLREEIENLMKPIRPRREHIEQKSQKVMTEQEWREDFIRRHKPGIQKRLGDLRNGKEDDEEET